jgi:uncharacterized protein involved in exopolysaccharide biosynthesis
MVEINDRARRQLAERLDDVLGTEEADLLLAHLPPVGWADVATKHDLDLHLAVVDQRFTSLEQRMARLESRMDQFSAQMADLQRQVGAFSRQLVVTVVAAVLGTIPAVYTASHFAG